MKNQSMAEWRVCLVCHVEQDYLAIQSALDETPDFTARLAWAGDLGAARARLVGDNFDVLLLNLDDIDGGLDWIREQVAAGQSAPFIVFSRQAGPEIENEAMLAGAALFLDFNAITPRTLIQCLRYVAGRRQIEKTLTQSLQQRSIILDSVQDGILGINFDWRITYINEPAARIVGLPVSELTGAIFWEKFPRLVGTELESYYREAMEKRVNVRFERRGLYNPQWFNIRIGPSPEGIAISWRNINERKLMEEDLAQSERKFRELVKFAPTAIYEVDFRNRRFLTFNDTMVDLSGYSREELLNMDPMDFLDDEGKALFTQRVAQWLKGEKPSEMVEYRVRHKDGHFLYALLGMKFTLDELGRPMGATVTVHDITARKLAEQALEQSRTELLNEKNRLLAVMEALPVGLAILDEKGGNVLTNAAYEGVWGQNRPDVNTVADYDMYQAWWVESGERVRPEEWASARAVQNGETVIGQFIRIRRFDGATGYILNSGAPIRDYQGRITGSVVGIIDITERVVAEAALAESNERLRVALSSLPISVYRLDRNLRYIWIYQPDLIFNQTEIIGKRDDDLYPAESAAPFLALKQQVIDSGQSLQKEVQVPANGEDHTYLLTLEPTFDPAGAVNGLLGASLNVTDQRRAEIERQKTLMQIEVQNRLMEQREQERQEMARDLHDGPIQTLSAIAFNLRVLHDTFTDPQFQLEINQISLDLKSAVRELREIMNELRPPSLMHFGLARVIQLYTLDMSERYPAIHIETDVMDDEKCLTEAATLALFRIFQAALTNVLRHSGATKTRILYHLEPDAFVLEVRDNGCGFDSNLDYARLARERHFGLVGMKERAESIGAQLAVTSCLNEGTTIRVQGPLQGNLKSTARPV